MIFPKFSEWVSIKEDQTPQAPATVGSKATPNSDVNKAIANLVGEPSAKRKTALKQLAQKKAMDPKAKPEDIAAIAKAAEEST